MSSGSTNIKGAAVNVFWRIEGQYTIDHSALSDPDGVYWEIDQPDGDQFYVWFDLDAGSTDPAPAGRTAIEVSVTTGDSATVIATAAAAAIDAVAGFSATSSGAIVTLDQDDVGEPAADPVDVDSGVVITICRRGKDFNLGLLEGQPAPTTEVNTFDVTSHQTGTTIVSQLQTGTTVEVELVMQETQRSNLKEFFKLYGGAFTPGAGTEVFGYGTGAIGNNILVDGARLEFIPTNGITTTELDYQFNFMLSVPVPASLEFNSEEIRRLTVNFRGLPDLSKDNRVDTLLVGNPSQTGI